MQLAEFNQPILIGCEAGARAAGLATTDVREARLSYDGATDNKRRKSPSATIKSEDDELTPAKRKKLQANANDIQRNFEVGAWAIRKHLDFVTSFSFASNNAESVISPEADAGMQSLQRERSQLDDDIEGIITEASAAEHCDSAARHDLATMLRLAEARATVTGDHGLYELADGTIQSIESDRIRDPSGVDKIRDAKIIHGVQVDGRGRSVRYAIHSRTSGGGYKFERWVPAAHMMMRGYYERTDQVRGISPMAPAVNRLRDVYEGFDYALAKAKIAQLFGFKINRNGDDSLGPVLNVAADEEPPDYEIDLGEGPWMLDLMPGDEADIMETSTPSDQFQTYTEMMIAVALLSLDLPWNFFKVDATNFFGSRAALNLYMQSVKPKRRANLTLLNRWTRRQLQLAILRKKLVLPRSMTVDDLRYGWTPDGLPWWNPSQEADGALKSLGAGLDNPQRICLETGTNFFDNVDRIAEAHAYAKARGVELSFALAGGVTIQQ